MSRKSADESEMGPMLVQRRICLWFCATVLVGVLLCAAYLVGRVSRFASGAKTSTFSAQAGSASSSERKPQVNFRPAAPPSQAAPAPATQVQLLKTSPAGTESQPTAFVSRPGSRPPGDTYLQIAALDGACPRYLWSCCEERDFRRKLLLARRKTFSE